MAMKTSLQAVIAWEQNNISIPLEGEFEQAWGGRLDPKVLMSRLFVNTLLPEKKIIKNQYQSKDLYYSTSKIVASTQDRGQSSYGKLC